MISLGPLPLDAEAGVAQGNGLVRCSWQHNHLHNSRSFYASLDSLMIHFVLIIRYSGTTRHLSADSNGFFTFGLYPFRLRKASQVLFLICLIQLDLVPTVTLPLHDYVAVIASKMKRRTSNLSFRCRNCEEVIAIVGFQIQAPQDGEIGDGRNDKAAMGSGKLWTSDCGHSMRTTTRNEEPPQHRHERANEETIAFFKSLMTILSYNW